MTLVQTHQAQRALELFGGLNTGSVRASTENSKAGSDFAHTLRFQTRNYHYDVKTPAPRDAYLNAATKSARVGCQRHQAALQEMSLLARG